MAPRKPRATNGNGNDKAVTSVEGLKLIATTEKNELPANINIGFANILDDEPDLTFDEACNLSGCLTPYELQEYLESFLPDLDVWGLKTIPACYMPQLAEIKRSIEAQNSVKKLETESTAQPLQMPVEAPAIPLIEDEPIPQPESTSAIAQSDPSELGQGHLENQAETLQLETLRLELQEGASSEEIAEKLELADSMSADAWEAFRQRYAENDAVQLALFIRERQVSRARMTNSRLNSTGKAAELQRQVDALRADFLQQNSKISDAKKNRRSPSL